MINLCLRQRYATAGYEGKEKILAKVGRVSPTVFVEDFERLAGAKNS
jgi:hypothetical protein